MSRVREIAERQEKVNKTVELLLQGKGDYEELVEALSLDTCPLRPFMDEWDEATRPGRLSLKDIETLKALREKAPNAKSRAHLDAALENLTAKPAPWVRQLEVQAQLTDAFDKLQAIIEAIDTYVELGRAIVKKAGTKSPNSTALQDAVKPALEGLLAKLVVLTCPTDNQRGVVAYCSREQRDWLENSAILFKRAGLSTAAESGVSRRGSDYFYLLEHIESGGVLEDQEFYTTFDGDDTDGDFLDEIEFPEDLDITGLVNADDEPHDSPIDENTVAIDETLVETD